MLLRSSTRLVTTLTSKVKCQTRGGVVFKPYTWDLEKEKTCSLRSWTRWKDPFFLLWGIFTTLEVFVLWPCLHPLEPWGPSLRFGYHVKALDNLKSPWQGVVHVYCFVIFKPMNIEFRMIFFIGKFIKIYKNGFFMARN